MATLPALVLSQMRTQGIGRAVVINQASRQTAPLSSPTAIQIAAQRPSQPSLSAEGPSVSPSRADRPPFPDTGPLPACWLPCTLGPIGLFW